MHDPGLNFDLGDTIDSLRDAIQDFVAAEITPRAAEIDRDNLFPHDLWAKLGELGLHGMTVKEEYGGTELGYLAHIVAMEEVSRGSASVGEAAKSTAQTTGTAPAIWNGCRHTPRIVMAHWTVMVGLIVPTRPFRFLARTRASRD